MLLYVWHILISRADVAFNLASVSAKAHSNFLAICVMWSVMVRVWVVGMGTKSDIAN